MRFGLDWRCGRVYERVVRLALWIGPAPTIGENLCGFLIDKYLAHYLGFADGEGLEIGGFLD